MTTCNCNEWGGDRLNECGKWVCDRCEEKCPCPDDNWPLLPDTRKRANKPRRYTENFHRSECDGVRLQVTITGERKREAERRHPGKPGPYTVDLFAIEKSPTDKSLDREIVCDHCPLGEVSNVKDKSRRVYSVKENGRTDSSKREPKEHVQHREAMPVSNVEDFDRQSARHRGISKTDQTPENEYFESQESSREDEEKLCTSNEDIEEKNVCTCGCKKIVEDSGEQVCPCGCAETLKLQDNTANLGDDCESAEPCNLCACALSSGRSSSGSTLETEDKKITTRGERSPNELGDIKTRSAIEDIGYRAKKLEEEIDSVKTKNEKLKELFETCYCEEGIEQIMALQCSQPPPIRATHSALMAAVQVLQSKCRSKDGMIAVLANELRGSESVDRIAKNLTAPCLRYTYLDFDHCGLYAYLKSPTLSRSVVAERMAPEKFSDRKAKEEISSSKIRRTPESINFRVVRAICNYLLVSWNSPEDIREISGYEIRINRNVVAARVRCPTRTTTVLGPLDLSGPSLDLPGLMILTLYAVHPTGDYSELSNVKVRICNSP